MSKIDLLEMRISVTTDYIDEMFSLMADILPPAYLQDYSRLRDMWVDIDNDISDQLKELDVPQTTEKD